MKFLKRITKALSSLFATPPTPSKAIEPRTPDRHDIAIEAIKDFEEIYKQQ